MQQIFVYGTLTDEEVQKRIIGRVVLGIPDILQGYSLSTIEIEGNVYPLIVPANGKSVKGLVMEVTEEELRQMDTYEGEEYERTIVLLESGREAFVYVASN